MNPLCNRYRFLVDSIKAYQSEPLDEKTKQRICDYLVNPTPTAWSDISGITINNRLLTVWRAVRQVDPSFPATGRRYEIGSGRLLKEWDRIPHPDLVLRAIEHARNEAPHPADRSR
ncbi:MAG: hypothetical protein ABSD38_37340 [Syntrophorhabdales bacterium]